MAVIEYKAKNLAEILNAVSKIRAKWNPDNLSDEEIWFRGSAQRKYKLTPGIYRDLESAYEYDEYSLVTTFISHSSSYQPNRPNCDWEWYFLAQHYRLPTRLLDWTESLLVAAYFALSNEMTKHDLPTLEKKILHIKKNKKQTPIYSDNSPVIWVLDAGSLNSYSKQKDVFYPAPHDEINDYCWNILRNDKIHDENLKKPVAIVPKRLNPRIVAQQGTFTLHGTSKKSIDELANNDSKNIIKLSKIVLDKNSLPVIWDELRIAGISRSFIYQDLDNLAEHIKFLYQKSPRNPAKEVRKKKPTKPKKAVSSAKKKPVRKTAAK